MSLKAPEGTKTESEDKTRAEKTLSTKSLTQGTSENTAHHTII